jgi:hypothetical protein
MAGDLIGDGGAVPSGDSAAVTEQHADRDVGRVAKRPVTLAG